MMNKVYVFFIVLKLFPTCKGWWVIVVVRRGCTDVHIGVEEEVDICICAGGGILWYHCWGGRMNVVASVADNNGIPVLWNSQLPSISFFTSFSKKQERNIDWYYKRYITKKYKHKYKYNITGYIST